MITVLAILYFIIVQCLFNEYVPPRNVEWSVFYYVSMWLTMFVAITDAYFHRIKHSIIRKMAEALLIPIFAQMIKQLSCIGKSYDQWFRSMEGIGFEMFFLTLVTLLSVLVIRKYLVKWVKNFVKIG